MRRTTWTLLIALLLQLVVGSAWALRPVHSIQASGHAVHCHDMAPQATGDSDPQHTTDPVHASTTSPDSHHCCAVGLGSTMQPQPQALPQAVPTSQHGPWVSLSLRPDLRPPI